MLKLTKKRIDYRVTEDDIKTRATAEATTFKRVVTMIGTIEEDSGVVVRTSFNGPVDEVTQLLKDIGIEGVNDYVKGEYAFTSRQTTILEDEEPNDNSAGDNFKEI